MSCFLFQLCFTCLFATHGADLTRRIFPRAPTCCSSTKRIWRRSVGTMMAMCFGTSKVREHLSNPTVTKQLISILGVESQAVVEYALNQKAPPEKKKIDSRHATIQQGMSLLSPSGVPVFILYSTRQTKIICHLSLPCKTHRPNQSTSM